MTSRNSFNTRTEIRAGGQTVQIHSLPALDKAGFSGVSLQVEKRGGSETSTTVEN